MRRIVRTSAAETDLIEIWLRIASDSLTAADRWIDRIDQALTRLAEFPGMGAMRDELEEGLRSFPFGDYLIFYTHNKEVIRIVRILHGARDVKSILGP